MRGEFVWSLQGGAHAGWLGSRDDARQRACVGRGNPVPDGTN